MSTPLSGPSSSGPSSSGPSSSGPDHSVRVAWADDADAIAALQLEDWRATFSDLVPLEALPDSPDEMAAAWRQALSRPADARNRVLVALDRQRVVGFAITGPGSDPDSDPVTDGEIREFVIAPREQHRGHGSRLLQAAADTLRADRFTRARVWLGTTDDRARRFLAAAGWATDTAHRELEAPGGSGHFKQVRLHTDLRESSPEES